jgi:hypothetical protein
LFALRFGNRLFPKSKACVCRLTRFQLQHPAAQGVAFELTTQCGERVLPRFLYPMDTQTVLKPDRMHGIRTYAAS